MKSQHALLLITALLALAGCKRAPIVHQYKSVPLGGWSRSDTLTFRTDSISADRDATFSVGVCTSVACEYPYQELWLIAEQDWQEKPDTAEGSTPHTLRTDTICCRITNEEGDPLGKGVTQRQISTPVATVHLKEGSQGTFRLRHIMNDNSLTGITAIGIELR